MLIPAEECPIFELLAIRWTVLCPTGSQQEENGYTSIV